MSHMEGPHGDSEDDPDFIDSGTENDDDDDVVYGQNVTAGIEVGVEGSVSERGSDIDNEVDELQYPSLEELLSDYDSDEDVGYRYPEFNAETDMQNPTFTVGQKFRSVQEFRQAVRSYGAVNRYNIKFKTNDESRVQGVCKLGCQWKIWASKVQNTSTVQVKSYCPEHTCSRDQTNRHCTYIYLAKRYIETFIVDPDWKTKSIIATVKKDLKSDISRNVAWKTRRYARQLIEGTLDEQFGLLGKFSAELLRTNPGSTVIVAIHDGVFHGFYICFNACKLGFVNGCRKMIGLDGCHLRGNYGGQLLSAVALDANNCIYPVAYAVVEKENNASWRWFITHLGEDLGIENSSDWAFMTDRQKGLQNVLDGLFPDAEHRFCVRHMYSNFFNKGFKGKLLKDYLWRATKATIVADYRSWMLEIKNVNEEAYNWLMERNPKEWSKSHFSVKVKTDILLNNGCEVFNKTLLDDREKMILSMLISIQTTFMKRIQMRRDKMRRYNGRLCPKIKIFLERYIAMSNDCTLDWSGGPQYQVQSPNGAFVVDLEARTCACRRWDLTGIPCSHAVAVIRDTRNDPEDYVDNCYTVEQYLKCYEHILYPINDKKLWPEISVEIKVPSWSIPHKGRQQRKRRKQADETVTEHSQSKSILKRKGQVVMTCSECGLQGHNKRYHLRGDALAADWYTTPVEQVENEGDNQRPGKKKAKLTPRRSNRNASNQPHEAQSGFHFMPTPGVDMRNAAVIISIGPSASPPVIEGNSKGNNTSHQIRTEDINISTMVEELEILNASESARSRDERARARRERNTSIAQSAHPR